MNFLAHAHLSGENTNILFGNFIADAVKGNASTSYKDEILDGITLHRKIDTFTDAHPIHKKSRNLIRSDFGKYSGVVIDIYYDHFLAKQWDVYASVPLKQYTSWVYKQISKKYLLLPNATKRFLPFMISQNWLLNYANYQGLDRIFHGMDRRTKFNSGMSSAVEILKINYEPLKNDFNSFYPELLEYVKKQLGK